ncbi:MAG: glucose-1-phosphate adenylyltransferase subunit GlgD, partial [Eubacterium sp.]|nr:glucose-1-phosphate adenylyltransferase subunit GlgD [Eubacterium sp.]
MNGKKVLGLIFANIHEEALESLTNMRTMGSVPFCSRYRLIDFPLSNMVESQISNVGVVTNSNFNSLMDHVGTGKPWDLSRKSDGLYLLPPYSLSNTTMWGNRIDAIYGNMNFLDQSNQEWVLMSDCYNIMNIDFEKVFEAHEKTGAAVTIVGVKGKKPANMSSVLVMDDVAEDGKINSAVIDPDSEGEVFYSCNIVLIKK